MVNFGERMEKEKARLMKHLNPQAFVDYNLLKLYLKSSAPKPLSNPDESSEDESVIARQLSAEDIAFFEQWDHELQKTLSGIGEVLRGQQYCSVPCGPFRMSCAGDALTPEVADALFSCIELNREALRKIVKKYDKNRPGVFDMQADRVRVFDMVMAQTMDECEQQAVFSVHHHRKVTRVYQGLMVLAIVVVAAVSLVVMRATSIQVCFVLGLAAGFMTAWGNAANDICNSVGTAVGAGALSLAQAVTFGALFEVIGCLTLGPFVSKSIVKGIIDTEDYVLNPEVYAFGMCCVLFGAGSTTLLATFYGYPISATHGIIGGLIAVGMAAQGAGSVGWGRVGMIACGWVGAPVVGGLMSMLVSAVIHFTIYKTKNPAARSSSMQPFYVWLCFAINILFVLVKGPSFMKVKPLWLACIIAAAAAIAAIPVFYLGMEVMKRLNSKGAAGQPDKGGVVRRMSLKMQNTLSLNDNDASGSASGPTSPKKRFSFREFEDEPVQPEEPKDVEAPRPQQPEAAPPGEKPEEPKDVEATAPVSKKEDLGEPVTPVAVKPVEVAKEVAPASSRHEAEKYFVPLLIISALSVACAHGGNDVGNAVGPLSAIIMVSESGTVAEKPEIPFWALVYGSAGFVIGIVTMGRMTIKTVGTKITTLTPSKSFATQMGAAVAVLGSSALGLPVSTSHCLVGSVVGIGVFESLTKTGKLNLSVLARIALAWGLTIPLAMIISASCFLPLKHIFETSS